jgi:hypothetical protein
MRIQRALIAFLTVCALPAAADGPWFGIEMPSERSGVWDPRMERLAFNLGWGPLTLRLTEEQDPYQDLKAEELLAHIEEVVEIAEQSRGELGVWGRMPGSRYERMAAEYVADQFRELGLEEVRIESFDIGPQWRLRSHKLTLLADPAYGERTRDFVLEEALPIGGCLPTPEEGIEAELVYVGLGRPADLVGRDLQGKIAVVRSYMHPSPNSHTGEPVPEWLAKTGAAGFIMIMDVPEHLQFSPILARPKGGILGFCTNSLEGNFIEDVLLRAADKGLPAPRVRIRVDSGRTEPKQGLNTLGLIRGETDEYVIVIAHTDSFFQGAIDNGSGIGHMLALARHYSRPDAAKPRRNILFVATCGHHIGSPGVKDLITRYPEVMAGTVYATNWEHIAAVWAYQFNRGARFRWSNTEFPVTVSVSNKSPMLLELLHEAVDRYGIVCNLETSHYPGGDPFPFWTAGVPVVNLIGLPLYYHTNRDDLEVLSKPGLERVARAAAFFIDQTMKRSRQELENGAIPSPWAFPPNYFPEYP